MTECMTVCICECAGSRGVCLQPSCLLCKAGGAEVGRGMRPLLGKASSPPALSLSPSLSIPLSLSIPPSISLSPSLYPSLHLPLSLIPLSLSIPPSISLSPSLYPSLHLPLSFSISHPLHLSLCCSGHR